jgi:hypothetical protein
MTGLEWRTSQPQNLLNLVLQDSYCIINSKKANKSPRVRDYLLFQAFIVESTGIECNHSVSLYILGPFICYDLLIVEKRLNPCLKDALNLKSYNPWPRFLFLTYILPVWLVNSEIKSWVMCLLLNLEIILIFFGIPMRNTLKICSSDQIYLNCL